MEAAAAAAAASKPGAEEEVAAWGSSMALALALTTLSGLATGLGGLLAVSMQQGFSTRTLGFSQGLSAGFMISVTVLEVLPEALRSLTIADAVAWVCIGSAVIYLLQALVPEPDLSGLLLAERRGQDGRKVHIDQGSIPLLNSVLWSGLLTALSLALHNFPEGIAVSVAATQGLRFSFPLTVAIAAHNIPEGASVALPIFFSLRDKRKAVIVALLSGLAEPLGVLVLFSIGPAALSPQTIARLLAFVGGVMISLSCFELLPQAKALLSAPEALRAAAFGFILMAAILTALHALDSML